MYFKRDSNNIYYITAWKITNIWSENFHYISSNHAGYRNQFYHIYRLLAQALQIFK